MIIDAHHHLWPADVIDRQPWRPADDGVLRRAFDAEEWERELDASAIDASIVMQSVDDVDENTRLAAYARTSPRILGWVGYADLASAADGVAQVDGLLALRTEAGGDKLVGVRCLVGTDPMAWTAEPDGRRALLRAADGGLVWDTVPITDDQVDAISAVARAAPHLRIVVDHLASPPMSEDGFEDWVRRVRRLAEAPNIAIKLSVGVAVLQRWASWDDAALRPHVDVALAAFGPSRCMLASNWPVVLLRASHRQAWNSVVRAVRDLDGDDRRLVTGGTAAHWYGLGAHR